MTEPSRETTRTPSKRQAAILRRLSKLGFASTTSLANHFQVSEMSIRRDAAAIEKLGLARRVHGGLVSLRAVTDGSRDFFGRNIVNSMEKEVIARAAAQAVGDQDVIVIDAGTTAYQFARALPETFRGTVISHSLPVFNLMLNRSNVTTISLGGELYRRSQAFIGSSALTAARELKAGTFFMGAAALDARGIYASLDIEKEIKRALIGICQNIVLLADSTKFNANAPVALVPWDDRFTVLTDRLPSTELLAEFADRGVRVDEADSLPAREGVGMIS
ncbi:DeoR/GlpR family DNA-binding transcription regulator [Acidipropionibacterium virtanenii]|uniref:Glucitol operon repressor n=1 Tax=Acidipropionibacterium virtanenii TaxID=2057246 RepID=A0A344UQY7_9ACTN|nr:DeoR/GlpR family DNA-binding transcription regulator [Acidipropionibacterium virtanenii]AXE37685.1 Glucitol operon repressor [Acidipropionibacterium virtanenii]